MEGAGEDAALLVHNGYPRTAAVAGLEKVGQPTAFMRRERMGERKAVDLAHHVQFKHLLIKSVANAGTSRKKSVPINICAPDPDPGPPVWYVSSR